MPESSDRYNASRSRAYTLAVAGSEKSLTLVMANPPSAWTQGARPSLERNGPVPVEARSEPSGCTTRRPTHPPVRPAVSATQGGDTNVAGVAMVTPLAVALTVFVSGVSEASDVVMVPEPSVTGAGAVEAACGCAGAASMAVRLLAESAVRLAGATPGAAGAANALFDPEARNVKGWLGTGRPRPSRRVTTTGARPWPLATTALSPVSTVESQALMASGANSTEPCIVKPGAKTVTLFVPAAVLESDTVNAPFAPVRPAGTTGTVTFEEPPMVIRTGTPGTG